LTKPGAARRAPARAARVFAAFVLLAFARMSGQGDAEARHQPTLVPATASACGSRAPLAA
jgi:hypothetical protein